MNAQGWHCSACHETGVWHCAHPEECGGMVQILDDKGRPKIGHKRCCVTINCLGCGADFFSTDYR